MTDALAQAEKELLELKARVAKLRREACGETVTDYVLKDLDGSDVSLSALFGNKDDLIVVHNMGAGCSYCTLWADGFNGLAHQLNDRAAFVLVSADPPEAARAFSAARKWTYRVVSGAGSAFASDMGFAAPDGSPWPGTSVFHKGVDGALRRIGRAPFGPGDDFCALWHFFDLLKDQVNGWGPRNDTPVGGACCG